jgi:hypothetical protein
MTRARFALTLLVLGFNHRRNKITKRLPSPFTGTETPTLARVTTILFSASAPRLSCQQFRGTGWQPETGAHVNRGQAS